MPTEPAAVTVDDLFDALERLGTPTVFYAADHDPDARDIPQLLGVLSLAADKLAVHHRLGADGQARAAWAAGYLGTAGANNPCADRAVFDVLTMRLQMLEDLLAGYRGGGITVDLVRTCLTAAIAFAVVAATVNAARAGALPAGTGVEADELVSRHIDNAEQAMAAARLLQARFRTSLGDLGPHT